MKVIVVAALGLSLTACNMIPAPLQDLSIVRIRLLAPDQLPTMPTRSPPDRRRDYLVLTLATRQNLIRKSTAAELNIYPMIVDCARRDRTLFAYGPYLDGFRVSDVDLDKDHPRYKELGSLSRRRFEYHLFIPVRGQIRLESDFNRRVPGYDLGRQPFDLCIRIGGGNMLGGHFRSNEVRVHFGPDTRAAR